MNPNTSEAELHKNSVLLQLSTTANSLPNGSNDQDSLGSNAFGKTEEAFKIEETYN